LKKLGVVFAVLFGSRARGQNREDSDFDIAVLFDRKPNYRLFQKLFNLFSDLFPGKSIDLRFLNQTDSFFRYQVLRDGWLILGDRKRFLKEKILAHKIYIDEVLPLIALRDKLFQKQLKRLENLVFQSNDN